MLRVLKSAIPSVPVAMMLPAISGELGNVVSIGDSLLFWRQKTHLLPVNAHELRTRWDRAAARVSASELPLSFSSRKTLRPVSIEIGDRRASKTIETL
jgi:hypothetical protein